jgi:hypothetical protein
MLIYSHHVVESNHYTSIATHMFHVQFLVLVTVAKVTQHGVGNIQCFCLIQRIVVTWQNVWMKMVFVIDHNIHKERDYAWMNCPCIFREMFIQDLGCLVCLCQFFLTEISGSSWTRHFPVLKFTRGQGLKYLAF